MYQNRTGILGLGSLHNNLYTNTARFVEQYNRLKLSPYAWKAYMLSLTPILLIMYFNTI